MKTTLDCIPCFVRQSLNAVRMVTTDPALQERFLREVLQWMVHIDMHLPPPVMAQRIHRRLKEIVGNPDPYFAVKRQSNRMALELLPELKTSVEQDPEPLVMAMRLAVAGNIIDMGVSKTITAADIQNAINQALTEPLVGPLAQFKQTLSAARHILYLADNAGEIVFDRLLIEQLAPRRVTVAVRGAPILNDATISDARDAGLDQLVELIDNGSDAPGTLLADCSESFRNHFESADLVIAKGQGNFESLSREQGNIFFLFKAKCHVIAAHAGLPLGTQVLAVPQNEVSHERV